MGRVRTKYIKRTARKLIEKFPKKFTNNFEVNKATLNMIAEVQSKKIRNRVAGYITSLRKKEITIKSGGG